MTVGSAQQRAEGAPYFALAAVNSTQVLSAVKRRPRSTPWPQGPPTPFGLS